MTASAEPFGGATVECHELLRRLVEIGGKIGGNRQTDCRDTRRTGGIVGPRRFATRGARIVSVIRWGPAVLFELHRGHAARFRRDRLRGVHRRHGLCDVRCRRGIRRRLGAIRITKRHTKRQDALNFGVLGLDVRLFHGACRRAVRFVAGGAACIGGSHRIPLACVHATCVHAIGSAISATSDSRLLSLIL